MRIVSVGKYEADPADLQEWLAGESAALRERVRREVESAWGFVLELGPGEEVGVGGVCHYSEGMGLQVAWKMSDLDGQIGFFLHGFRAGDPILVDEQEIPTPEPGEIDIRLAVLYMPPSISPYTTSAAWRCPKCGYQQFSMDAMRVSTGWSHDFSNHELTGVTCSNCGYLEFYNMPVQHFRTRFLSDSEP